jgi:predicted phosphodiesterase
MKLALASDIHLEFGDINLTNTEDAEVLILSGDIMIAQELHDFPLDNNSLDLEFLNTKRYRAERYRDFLLNCSKEFPHTIYVAGNHEFYHGKFYAALDYLRHETNRFDNVYFLEDETKKIDDITFIGCTLWTDMNKGDPVTLYQVKNNMNDYHVIKNDHCGFRRLLPEDVLKRHLNSKNYIKNILEDNHNEKFVVVGHMAPSSLSVHEQYVNDKEINGAYVSNLEEFILDHPQIKVWTHGHTHHNYDYKIGDTRIICNPRGYVGYETQADEFELQCFEV